MVSGGSTGPGVWSEGTTLHPRGQTDTCDNVTFPQLRLGHKNYWKMGKSTGKVREFCQSRKVGTMLFA